MGLIGNLKLHRWLTLYFYQTVMAGTIFHGLQKYDLCLTQIIHLYISLPFWDIIVLHLCGKGQGDLNFSF